MSRSVGFSESGTGSAYPPVPTPSWRACVTKLPPDLDPSLVARITDTGGGGLATQMGTEFPALSAELSPARMPVLGNTQVVGILHGGAHVVLGESLGSISAAIHGGPTKYPGGTRINRTPRPPLT